MRRLSLLFAVIVTMLVWPADSVRAQRVEHSVGFQAASAPDGAEQPLRLAIWYPSDAPAGPTQVGPYNLNVAMDGALSGHAHPLIVMSHGTGGSSFNSSNLAVSLAEHGFVLVAVTHTGDNYQDRRVSFSRQNFVDRPRHITRVIDFMLNVWANRNAIDPNRIGIFGHSAGGATSLIAIGGQFDWKRVTDYCQSHAQDDWGCRNAREHRPSADSTYIDAPPIVAGDPRIRAAVVAAPALSLGFEPQGLAHVSVPLQVWVAANDVIVPDAGLLQSLFPRPIEYHRVSNAGHFSFLTPCNAVMMASAPEICTDPPGFDRAEFQRSFSQDIVRFFEANLPAGH